MANDEIRRNGISLGLIAKTDAMININEAITSLFDGKRVMVDIAGDAGLGKSRLKMEIKKLLHGQEKPFIFLEAISTIRPEIPYSLISGLLYSYINYNYLDDVDNLRQLISKCEDPSLVERIFEILYILPQTREISFLVGQKRKIALLILLKTFFRKIAEKGFVVFFLEDFHSADDSSRELLWTVIDDLHKHAGCRGFVAFLTHEGEEALPQNLHMEVKRIKLKNLSPSESADFATALLSSPDLPKNILDEIVTKTFGNPLFIEEAIKLMIDMGFIYKVGDRWFFKRDTAYKIPDDLFSIVSLRVSHLPESTEELLQFISTFDLLFSLSDLKDMSEDTDFPFYLEELEKRKIIFQIGSYHDARIIFKHYKLKDIIYQGITAEKKRQFHEKIAKSIESGIIKRSQQNSFYALYHYMRAGKTGESLKHLEKSVLIATSLFSLGFAERLLMQSLDHLESTAGQSEETKKSLVRLYSLLCRLHSMSKNFASAERSIRKSIEHAEDTKELSIIANAYRALGVVKRERENYGEAVESFQIARKIAANSRDLRIILEIERDIGVALRMKGDVENALIVFQKAYDMSTRIGYDDLSGLFMNNIAMLYQKRGELEIACTSFKKAFEIKNKLKEPKSLVLTLNDYVFLLIELGNYDEAKLHIDRAIELAEDIFDYEYFIRSLALKALCEYRRENYEISKTYWDRAKDIAKIAQDEITDNEIKRWEKYFER